MKLMRIIAVYMNTDAPLEQLKFSKDFLKSITSKVAYSTLFAKYVGLQAVWYSGLRHDWCSHVDKLFSRAGLVSLTNFTPFFFPTDPKLARDLSQAKHNANGE